MKWGNITNKNVMHPLPRDLWPPNVTGWLRRHIPQSLLPIQSPGFCKSKKLYFHIYKGLWLPHLIGWWLRGKRLQPTKSHECILKWPCVITWRIKDLICTISQALWTPNLTGWQPFVKWGNQLKNHITLSKKFFPFMSFFMHIFFYPGNVLLIL